MSACSAAPIGALLCRGPAVSGRGPCPRGQARGPGTLASGPHPQFGPYRRQARLGLACLVSVAGIFAAAPLSWLSIRALLCLGVAQWPGYPGLPMEGAWPLGHTRYPGHWAPLEATTQGQLLGDAKLPCSPRQNCADIMHSQHMRSPRLLNSKTHTVSCTSRRCWLPRCRASHDLAQGPIAACCRT